MSNSLGNALLPALSREIVTKALMKWEHYPIFWMFSNTICLLQLRTPNQLVNCLLLSKPGSVTLALSLPGKEGEESCPLVVTWPLWFSWFGIQEAKTGDSIFPAPSSLWCPEQGGSQAAAAYSPGG